MIYKSIFWRIAHIFRYGCDLAGSIATDFYFGQLGSLLRDEPNWLAAIIFYLLYIFGIVYFN